MSTEVKHFGVDHCNVVGQHLPSLLPPPPPARPIIMRKHTCAAAHIAQCGAAPGTHIESKFGWGRGPNHWCIHCCNAVHGNICTVQLTETDHLERQGITISITCLHSKGQAKMNATNNNGCLLYDACVDKLNELVASGTSMNMFLALGASNAARSNSAVVSAPPGMMR